MNYSSKFANAFCAKKGVENKTGDQTMAVLGVALVFSALVFDISELTVALLGGCLYLAVQAMANTGKKRPVASKAIPCHDATLAAKRCPPVKFAAGARDASRPRRLVPAPDQKDYRKVSVVPVEAPSFCSTGFRAEVDELVVQLLPNAEADLVVKKITAAVRRTICAVIPDAEVSGFASGNPMRCKAFGVAIPEVDIVIDVSPVLLARHLQARLTQGGLSAARTDPRKLQKAAIRAFTDELTFAGGFKFRRSAFRGEDPKVTLLAPSEITGGEIAVPFDVSVNSATPLHAAALLMQCGQLTPRAKELILLVRRWARDRGVSHSAKGHLSPYAWSNLAIYFLQVGVEDGALLPPLDGFARSSPPACKDSEQAFAATTNCTPSVPTGSQKSAAVLFKEFVRFYHARFEWRHEAVSVRSGRRAAPNLSLKLHIVDHADGSSTIVAPSIEDPFVKGRNLSTCMTGPGVYRMREEFARADELLSRGDCDDISCSLTTLLEPWAPPECDVAHAERSEEK